MSRTAAVVVAALTLSLAAAASACGHTVASPAAAGSPGGAAGSPGVGRPQPRPFVLPANSAVTTPLQRRILRSLVSGGFAGAGTGVCVYDLSTGRLLFAHHGATPLRPASNEKLLTSATALARWGPTHRFDTDLYDVGSLSPDGVFRGSLYLKGFGDPSLATPAFQRQVLHLRSARLEDFVSALKHAGIKRVVGRVVGDASYFDARRAVASWHKDEVEDCGPLSALSLDESTDARGYRVADPALSVASTLTILARRAGIPISRAAGTGVTPSSATLLYQDRSAPLSAVIASMNKRSDDFFAEMLAKGLGAAFAGAGSTPAGTSVERAYARTIGVSLGHVVVADGSGLSYADRETSADLVRLLVAEQRGAQWPVFLRSLAVAGKSGTLSERMRGTLAQGNLHAKTGTLDVASSLSGYVKTANAHLLVFSMLMNGGRFDLAAAQRTQDVIAVTLARSRPAGRIAESAAPGA